MRRLALILACCILGGRGLFAAIVVVQPTAGLPVAATQCGGTPTSCTYTMPTVPTNGNQLVAAVSFPGANTMSVADNGTSTWASTTSRQAAGAGSRLQVFYTLSVAGSPTTVTATPNAGASTTIFVAEYSGVASFDKEAGGSGTSTAPASTSTTATNANSLYVGAVVHDGSGTVSIAGGGTFTERGEAENTANEVQGYEDLVSSSAQTGPFTLGSSVAWGTSLVIFAPSGGTAPPTRTLLGVGKAAP